jgi:hypothetical protein
VSGSAYDSFEDPYCYTVGLPAVALAKAGEERGGFGGPFFVFNNSFLALLA